MDPYTRIAPLYDAVTSAFLRKPRQIMAEVCLQSGARRVLDIGCGTGAFAALLDGRVDVAAGMDASPAMLRKARASKEGAGRALFVQADATFPPFLPNSFDLVVYALVLHETSADADTLLRKGFELAPLVLALEWRMPERNIDCVCSAWTHGVERLAGKEHYRRFRAFMRKGGMNGLVHRVGARVLFEQALHGASLVLSLLGRPE